MKSTKINRNIGAAFLLMIFGLLFFVLISRFLYIQITGEAEGRSLVAKAAQKYLRSEEIEAKRGTIYDQKGKIIAEDTASYTLIAILDEKVTNNPKFPKHVNDPRRVAKELSKHIELRESEIYELLTKDGRFQTEFGPAGRNISFHKKEEIEALKLPGIIFTKDTKRSYPNGVFASNLIGYAQREQHEDGTSEIVGKMGIEKKYDKLLGGKNGKIAYESDLWGYLLPNSNKVVEEAKDGKDIHLTIDKQIQSFLEDTINKVDKQYQPERIMAIVADPKTGRILAMSQRPTFHPVTRAGIKDAWKNELIESDFEPGSPMKIFSLASAIEEGVYHPNATFESGRYKVPHTQNIIRDHNEGRGWGKITYAEGVQRSSNVAFAKLLESMGMETYRDYLKKFQFGQSTNSGLPHEASGKILYKYPIEKVTTAIGQGSTVTGMQMIQAMTAIANDGKMMKPYIVDKVVDLDDKSTKKTKPKVVSNPISKQTATEVRDVLETVVTGEHGTGKMYRIDGYSVAGKTGTAQIPNPDGGGYLKGNNNYIFSFLGMAPKDDPKLIMYVAVDRPQLEAGEKGSTPVSMIFNPVMKSSLQYLNIEPEKIEEAKISKVPDLTGHSLDEAVKKIENAGFKPAIVGNGKEVQKQLPEKGTVLVEGEQIVLKTDGQLTVPDMIGWSKRDVLKVAKIADLPLNMVGNGYVETQNLKPHTPLHNKEPLVVNFIDPEALNAKQKETNDE